MILAQLQVKGPCLKQSVPLGNKSLAQLSRVALMKHFAWSVDLWRVQAEWRSTSMEFGEQCVLLDGITMMPKLCAVGNWGSM